MIFQEKNW